MRRALLPLFLATAAWPVHAALAQDGGVPQLADVVKVEGTIDGHLAGLVRERIDVAAPDGVVILQLDSPGTLGVDAAELAEDVAAADVPVVVWVGPPGSTAEGGAVALLAAADVAATSPLSGIGPGRPADLSERPPDDVADATRLAELTGSLADQAGRNGDEVRGLFRDPERRLTPQESLDRGVVDLAAPSIPDLLRDLNGREVDVDGATRELVTEGPPEEFALRFSELGPVGRVLHAVTSPVASYLLLVLGLWAIVFELTQPGFGLAGVAGAAFLALGGYSLAVLPVNWIGFGLLVLGLALLTADVLLRRLGALTALGTASFAAGSYVVYGGVAPAIDLSPWLIWTFVIGSVLYFGFALTAAIRAREHAVAQRQSGLVGLVGEAASDLAPEGHVVVKGAMWKGRSVAGPIPGGSRVRVRHVEGLVLEVTAEP